MFDTLLAAVAFVLIVEGLLPALSPKSLRVAYQQICSLPDTKIRRLGLVSMTLGMLLLWLLVNR